MNLKVEHGIIAVLVLALLYYVFTHYSLLNDLSVVPHKGNPQLKAVKGKHGLWEGNSDHYRVSSLGDFFAWTVGNPRFDKGYNSNSD